MAELVSDCLLPTHTDRLLPTQGRRSTLVPACSRADTPLHDWRRRYAQVSHSKRPPGVEFFRSGDCVQPKVVLSKDGAYSLEGKSMPRRKSKATSLSAWSGAAGLDETGCSACAASASSEMPSMPPREECPRAPSRSSAAARRPCRPAAIALPSRRFTHAAAVRISPLSSARLALP